MSAPLTYLTPQAFDRACDRLSGAQAARTDAVNALAEAKCSLEHKRAELLVKGIDGKNAEAREATLRLKLFDEHTEALGLEVTLNEAKRDLEAARMSWDCLRYKLRLLEVQAVLELILEEGSSRAEVFIHDGREPRTVYHRQAIPYTDFPLPSMKLYIQQNGLERVVMLPSEY